ncbi:hypothetical protein RSAG8_03752, partial [Rhizoctonia solani AG-8 WAC10335]
MQSSVAEPRHHDRRIRLRKRKHPSSAPFLLIYSPLDSGL